MRINQLSNYFIKLIGYQKVSTGQARVGVCYQYIMTTVDGTEVLETGQQVTSNAYRPLQLPFMLAGLGRCQNYIEYVTFAHYPYVTFASHAIE